MITEADDIFTCHWCGSVLLDDVHANNDHLSWYWLTYAINTCVNSKGTGSKRRQLPRKSWRPSRSHLCPELLEVDLEGDGREALRAQARNGEGTSGGRVSSHLLLGHLEGSWSDVERGVISSSPAYRGHVLGRDRDLPNDLPRLWVHADYLEIRGGGGEKTLAGEESLTNM